MNKISIVGIVVLLLAGCGGGTRQAPVDGPVDVPAAEAALPDIASAAPDHVSIVFENEWTRALLVTLEPGDELPVHHGEMRIIYSLSDYTLGWTEGDSSTTEVSWTRGQTHWHAAGPHSVRNNVGSTTAEFLVVERRGAELTLETSESHDSETEHVEPAHVDVLLEEGAFRVAEVALAPGDATGLHEGGYRLIFSLSDYAIGWTERGVAHGDMNWSEGDAHWHEPGLHEAENTGEDVARYLVVTLLQ